MQEPGARPSFTEIEERLAVMAIDMGNTLEDMRTMRRCKEQALLDQMLPPQVIHEPSRESAT